MDQPEGGRKDSEPVIEITDARRVFGELVNRAGFGNERIVITRHGKPVAALVGMKDFEQLQPAAVSEPAA